MALGELIKKAMQASTPKKNDAKKKAVKEKNVHEDEMLNGADMANVKSRVIISGMIVAEPEYNEFTKQYRMFVRSMRFSGVPDDIPVLVTKEEIELDDLHAGACVKIIGEFQSHNESDSNGHRHLHVNVIPNIIMQEQEGVYHNEIYLDGYMCRSKLRKTPRGRKIVDFLLAVHRNGSDESSYIPCIAWAATAKRLAKNRKGTNIRIHGRIQSRQYKKPSEDFERTTY